MVVWGHVPCHQGLHAPTGDTSCCQGVRARTGDACHVVGCAWSYGDTCHAVGCAWSYVTCYRVCAVVQGHVPCCQGVCGRTGDTCHAVGVYKFVWGTRATPSGVRGSMRMPAMLSGVQACTGMPASPSGHAHSRGDTSHAISVCTLPRGHTLHRRAVCSPLGTRATLSGCAPLHGERATLSGCTHSPCRTDKVAVPPLRGTRAEAGPRCHLPSRVTLQNHAGLRHGDIPKHPARTRLPGRVPGPRQPVPVPLPGLF